MSYVVSIIKKKHDCIKDGIISAHEMSADSSASASMVVEMSLCSSCPPIGKIKLVIKY